MSSMPIVRPRLVVLALGVALFSLPVPGVEAAPGASPQAAVARKRLAKIHRETERLAVRVVRLRGEALRWGAAERLRCLDDTLSSATSVQRRTTWFLRAWRGSGRTPSASRLLLRRVEVVERDLETLRTRIQRCLTPRGTPGPGQTLVEVHTTEPVAGRRVIAWSIARSP